MPSDTPPRSADLLANSLKAPDTAARVANDPGAVDGLAEQAKAATDATFHAVQRVNALENDRVIYRMTTMFLGALALLSVCGIIGLSAAPALLKLFGKEIATPDLIKIPDALVAIASTSIGALAGLLSPIGAGRPST